MKAKLILMVTLMACSAFVEAKQDKLGLTPLYWIDLNGAETQQGSEILKGDNYDGFGPLLYENISYWGRKGCFSFNDARGQKFACGTGSFTLFLVARGGNAYSSDDAIVFALGKPFASRTDSPALELVIRNPITEGSNVNSNLVAVRTWSTADAATRDVIRTTVPGCYPAYRYVPYAIVYDATTTTLKLYANGVEIASRTGDFTGFTDATCHWQVASVRGGNSTKAGAEYTGVRDCCGVTDFRYYTQALSASEVATVSADFPLCDQTGENPYYHYAFDGYLQRDRTKPAVSNICQILGQDRVCNNNYRGVPDYFSTSGHNYFNTYETDVLRGEVCAARGLANVADCRGDFWPLTNSFTLAISAMVNPPDDEKNTILFALGTRLNIVDDGSGMKTGLVLLRREKGKVGLDWWDSNNDIHTGATANLGCTDANHIHDFAIVHDRSAGTVSLFVDGTCHGTFDFAGFSNSEIGTGNRTYGSWTFSGIHGGTPSMYSGSAAHTVEEFRFYTKALTAAQLCALSDAVPAWRAGTDPSGRLAHVHYSFDGSVAVEGHGLLQDNGSVKSVAASGYRSVRGGTSQAASVLASGNYGGLFPTNRPFTLFMSADPGYFTANGCLFTIGSINSSGNGIALMARNPGEVAVGNWRSAAYPQAASVPQGAGGALHAYAVNVDPQANTVQLFVDGVAAGEPTALPHPLNNDHWQFASIHGGKIDGFALNDELYVEDFRVYVPALTTAEIAQLANAYPAWCKTDGGGARPDYWYTFTPGGSVPLGAKVLRDGSTGSYRKPVAGDSPVRDGTYACTNINVTGTSYGNAGGLELGSAFSIFLSARVKRASSDSKSGVLLGLGSQTSKDTETFAIAAESTDAVSCYSFYGTERKTLLVQAPVPGMQEDFNAYCVTWDGTTLALYLNGAAVASKATGADFTGFTSGPRWQFGGIYGNPQEFFQNGVLTLEDFRVYGRVLSAEEVAAVSAELPRWPRGALWQGGDAGAMSDPVWQVWDWSAAKYGDWSYNATLAAGANASFGDSATPLALTVSSRTKYGEIYMNRPVVLSGNAISCAALTVAEGGSLKPADVSGLLSPGRKMAVVGEGTVSGIDFTETDAYGNKSYLRNGRLYYGDGSLPGMMLLFR